MSRLDNVIAIITGAAGGIGAATARRFIAEGASVALADREEAPLRDLAASLGERAFAFPMDVSNEAATRDLVAATVARFGGLDVYYANAGIEGRVCPVVDIDIADLDRTFSINLRSVVLGLKYAVPAMKARGGGSFIATSSVAGLVGVAGIAAYVASKHAVLGIVKCGAIELGPLGIRVNAISPGPIDNRMMRSIEEQAAPGNAAVVKAGFTAIVPLGRYGTSEEIAAAATFLASADSSYCNGTTIVCDGGFVAH